MADGLTARPDPRITPARPDLAADHLEGVVAAERYAAPRWRRVAATLAPVTARPDAEAPMTTQLLLGERFAVYEAAGGWVWGQAEADGYVGYAPEACFGPDAPAPTHRVVALQALVYPEPDLKTRPCAAAPYGAAVAAEAAEGAWIALADGGHVPRPHLAPLAASADDWVAEAARFLGAPYLWGGRSAAGIDCSGLIQVARQAAGLPCPRDSDMQAAAPGRDAPRLRRGDLVFWRGHVGVMLSPTRLLHANAFHMAVVAEPFAEAAARIEATGGGAVTARRRWPARPLSKPAPTALVSLP
ncbi:MAG: peptidase P60 [Rhodobacteraceae bacterium]|nr:MAG: peptidase P60 [Paracoccaceae bacterium]